MSFEIGAHRGKKRKERKLISFHSYRTTNSFDWAFSVCAHSGTVMNCFQVRILGVFWDQKEN